MHHPAPTARDAYSCYGNGVISEPTQVVSTSDGNIWVQDVDGRWANVHPPHGNLDGYGVRWFVDQYQLDNTIPGNSFELVKAHLVFEALED